MPEFRDRYDTAAVSNQVSQPPFAELVRRGRRHAHRTRTIRFAGVAVVAVLAVTSVLALPSEPGPNTPAATPAPSAEPGLWRPTFLNVDHGVVTNWDQATCTSTLFVTSDGGATWSEPRPLPGFPGRERFEAERWCLTPYVVPVAPDTLVIPLDARIEHAYVSVNMDPPTTSHISYDAGRTWQEYEPRIRTAGAVPDGVIPGVHCQARFQPGEYESPRNDFCAAQPQISWYDPQTGDRMVLRNNPPVAAAYTPQVAADGSIWVGAHDEAGDPDISVSRDRGRTWQDVSPASEDVADTGEATAAAVRAVDGTTAYFSLHTESAVPATPQLYRTTDGGETWQPLPAAHQFTAAAGMWVASDGTLFVVDRISPGPSTDPDGEPDLVAYRSDDGGDTFEEADISAVPVEQISGGFRGITSGFSAESATDAVSEDGLTWRDFERPEFRLPPEPTP